jgi:hypothetical protein
LSSSYARHTPAVSIIAKRADFPSLHQLSIQQMAQVIIDDDPPELRALQRRKFGEREDISLLKEVISSDAHVSRRGALMEKFDEVSTALNNSGSMPWRTDGKHCLDRYKLLLASFKRAERARASASGAEEEFNKKDQILSDIVIAADDADERGRVERMETARRDARLIQAGEEVRSIAMRRRTARHGQEEGGNQNVDANEDVATRNDRDHINETSYQDRPAPNSDDLITPTDYGRGRKRRRDIADLEEIFMSAEDRRADQEILRLKLETDRLELDLERAASLDSKEEKRLEILSSQNELQRQQQRDNTMMHMKMMSVMEDMLRKLDR